MKKLLVIIGLLVIISVSCTEKIETPAEGTIKGRVVSNFGIDTLKFVPEAEISTFPPHRSTTTDSLGNFELVVFPRTYKVKAKREPLILSCDTTVFNPPIAIDTLIDTVVVGSDSLVYTIVTFLEQTIETHTSVFDSVFTDEFDVDEGAVVDLGDIELPATLDTLIDSLTVVDTVSIDTLP